MSECLKNEEKKHIYGIIKLLFTRFIIIIIRLTNTRDDIFPKMPS